MSVSVWRRHLSKTEFLYEIFQLNIKIGNIVANAPTQKYVHAYGNALIATAQTALRYAQTGNLIRVNSDYSLELRRGQFQLCIGCIENIGTTAYIYLETMRRNDNLKPAKAAKMYDWEDEIGEKCDLIIGYLYKVMESDREIWNKKKHGKTG